MKLLNEEEISEWALNECRKGNDNPEMRNLITEQFYALSYCELVKDTEEMWLKIKHPDIAFYYYKWIRNDNEYINNICKGMLNDTIR